MVKKHPQNEKEIRGVNGCKMIYTFTTKKETEALRIVKSLDMALVLWNLLANGLKENEPARKELVDLLKKYGIDPDELVD
jgi:hypothetical protein